MCGLVSFHVFSGRSFFLQSGYCLLQFTALLLYVSYKCEHLENILRYNCWAVQKISGMIWNRFFFPWKHTPGTGKLRRSVMASRAFHLQSTTSHLAGSVTASIPSHFFAAHCFFVKWVVAGATSQRSLWQYPWEHQWCWNGCGSWERRSLYLAPNLNSF